MSAEELLNMLKEQGLDDEALKKLLSDALASLEGPAEEEPTEEEQAAEASRYLGVDL